MFVSYKIADIAMVFVINELALSKDKNFSVDFSQTYCFELLEVYQLFYRKLLREYFYFIEALFVKAMILKINELGQSKGTNIRYINKVYCCIFL